jgi:hypothetical protein
MEGILGGVEESVVLGCRRSFGERLEMADIFGAQIDESHTYFSCF